MKRKRFSEAQIIGVLKEAEVGVKKQELCRKHGITEQTFYRWRSKYGGLQVSDVTRLKQLEAENRQLKQLLAEAHLDQAALKELPVKKLVRPAARRQAVAHLVQCGLMSQRRACQLVGLHRSVARHQPGPGDDEAALRARLRVLAAAFPRYGYKLLHELLKREGLVVNAKKTYRLYREEHLQVRRKRRKRLPTRDRVPLPSLDGLNQRWSMDFMSDQLATGRRIRILNIVDDYSRECVGQLVDFSISGERVSRLLDHLALDRGRPQTIVLDNGPEFTSKALFLWAQRTGVRLRFIQPGKPCQNALVESFNGKFRDACLNEQWFVDLAEARRSIEAWRIHYNTVRPHSSLGFRSPEQFRLAIERAPDKASRSAILETTANGPLSPSHHGGYNAINPSLSTWT